MRLAGISVLVTRPQHQASDLENTLKELGAEVFRLSAIEIAPSESTELDEALQSLEQFDTVVLTSVNGVAAVCARMKALSIPIEKLASRRLAVIGPATGRALTESVRAPDVMPKEFVSEALGDALGDVKGLHILLARADIARPELAQILTARGAKVEQVAAYRIVRAPGNIELPDHAPHYITLTSSSAVRGTLEVLQAHDRQDWMSQSKLVCIGPITADTVRQLGYTPAAVATEYTVPGLVEALIQAAQKEPANA
jgi:uroporphyrinogen-III synthase